MTNKITMVALIALIILLGAMAFKTKKPNVPAMVTVNMPQLIQKHTQRLAQNNALSETERKAKAKTLAQAVNELLQRTAEDNKLILLPKGAVIAGVKDITDTIDQQIRLNHVH
jgi:parvulin-like peptidyl-prolyl isomerase